MSLKKFISLVLTIFLFAAPAYASSMTVLHKANTLNVYRGTVTGLRISAVDGGATASGGAFIDGANASITALADGNHQIEIYDSSGRMIKGVLKAPGSAEGLAADLLVNGDFSSATGWTSPLGHWSIGGGKATTSGGTETFYKEFAAQAAGALFKLTFDVVATYTSGAVVNRISGINGLDRTGLGTFTDYITSPIAAGASGVRGGSTTYVGSVDNLLCKVVLAPSTSGCTVVSAKGGVTYNFAYKNSSFTYNAASYYVIVRKLR
jgi:hypothetical protein